MLHFWEALHGFQNDSKLFYFKIYVFGWFYAIFLPFPTPSNENPLDARGAGVSTFLHQQKYTDIRSNFASLTEVLLWLKKYNN